MSVAICVMLSVMLVIPLINIIIILGEDKKMNKKNLIRQIEYLDERLDNLRADFKILNAKIDLETFKAQYGEKGYVLDGHNTIKYIKDNKICYKSFNKFFIQTGKILSVGLLFPEEHFIFDTENEILIKVDSRDYVNATGEEDIKNGLVDEIKHLNAINADLTARIESLEKVVAKDISPEETAEKGEENE